MRDRKKDLEDLLAHSIELQRRQQLLPQEKVELFCVCFIYNTLTKWSIVAEYKCH